MSNSCAKYYKKKQRISSKKSLFKGIKIFLKKGKEKNKNMVANDVTVSEKMKNKD